MAHLTGTAFVVRDDGQTVRVNEVDTITPIINPRTGQPYNQYGPYIDLGIIRASDVLSSSTGVLEIIPFIEGVLITDVFFSADNLALSSGGQLINLVTPNYSGSNYIIGTLPAFSQFGDSILTRTQIIASNKDSTPLADCPPLVAQGAFLNPFIPWSPLTAFSGNDIVIGNGHIQLIRTLGTSGTSLPSWNTSGGTTNDGSIIWTDGGSINSSATVHAWAHIINVPNLNIPKRSSLQFLQQPTNVVGGAAFDPPVQAIVLDQNENPYTLNQITVDGFTTGAFTASGQNTFTATTDPITGIATFTGLTMDVSPIGTTNLVIRLGDANCAFNTRVLSVPFNVTS